MLQMAKTARLTMFATRLGGEMNARRTLLCSLGHGHGQFLGSPMSYRDTICGCWTKNRGLFFPPKWMVKISWKKLLFFYGWFGGKTPDFWKHPCIGFMLTFVSAEGWWVWDDKRCQSKLHGWCCQPTTNTSANAKQQTPTNNMAWVFPKIMVPPNHPF